MGPSEFDLNAEVFRPVKIMDAEKDMQSLPDGPKDLCFNKNDFMRVSRLVLLNSIHEF